MGKFYKQIGDEIFEYDSYGEYVMARIGYYIGIGMLILIVYLWIESSL